MSKKDKMLEAFRELLEEYKKEQFYKKDIIDYLDKKLTNKKVLSIKDIVDILKKLCD